MHTPGAVRPYQFDIVSALFRQVTEHARCETLTVMFPRQSGKNEVSAMLVTALLLRHHSTGGSVIVCAPSLHPQATLSFERTIGLLRSHRRISMPKAEVEGRAIRFGLASATFLSGMPGANVAGHTASLALIGDEAQDLDSDWFDRQFKPMTASTGASTVLFGTPWQGDSLLERAVERNRKRDAAFQHLGPRYRGLWDPFHHQVSWEEVAEENTPYRTYVEKERDRLGATHPIFLSQYELVSVADEKRLLSPSMLWQIEGPFPRLGHPERDERYVAGLDFAGEGSAGDATVLTIGRLVDGACEVVHIENWRGAPYEVASSAIIAAAREWKLARLLCDATGLGAPLAASLKRVLGSVVTPFVFSRKSKSDLGFDLIAAAETGNLRIAPATQPASALGTLWDELRTCLVDYEARGTMTWGAPAGAHDDHVASLALCLRAATTTGAARVAVGRARM
ncbi:MAG TPA: hypothetical protein VIY56_09050 [Vicinamibacterales bacterium]